VDDFNLRKYIPWKLWESRKWSLWLWKTCWTKKKENNDLLAHATTTL